MAPQSVSGTSLLFGLLLLFACAARPQPGAETVAQSQGTAGSAKPDANRSSTASKRTTTDEPPDVAGSDPPGTAGGAEPSEEASPDPEPPTPAADTRGAELTFHPLDVLTGGDTAFLIDYPNSDARERDEQTCRALAQNERTPSSRTTKGGSAPSDVSSSGSPSGNEKADVEAEEKIRERVQACLTKERSKFTADVLRFRRDDRGQGTFTIYRRLGSALPEIHVARVSYEEVDTHTVKVKVTGNVNGARPICRDQRDLEVKIPNGYSIVLQDPVYGKLTYEAKIGLVAR